MTDMREQQPEKQVINLTADTFGAYTFEADIYVWTYSGIRSENVYSRNNTFLFRAEDMRHAHGLAQSMSHTISLAHDVWKSGISRVAQV